MIYQHRFQVSASLSSVAEFHRNAINMAAITPPPIIVCFHQAPAILAEGDEMSFTMWLGPLPLHWLARIEDVSPKGFTDRQLQGPFAEWVHRHTFEKIDEQTTAIIDAVTFRLRTNPIEWLVGMGMRLGLPVMFAYRKWKTRRLIG